MSRAAESAANGCRRVGCFSAAASAASDSLPATRFDGTC